MNNKNNISFLQVAHFPNDDRVWFHQADTLMNKGYDVSVISTRTNHSDLESVFCFDDTRMPKKLVSQKVSDILANIKPNIIICDNPLAVYFVSKYRKKHQKDVKVIIDITEWYPSKKNLVNLNFLSRIVKKTILHCMNIYSGFIVDGFIFGEYHKAKMFKRFFKRKPFVDLPYYPDLKYIDKGKTKLDFSTWKVLYSGSLTNEKGFDNVIKAMQNCANENQCYNFELNIISNDIPDENQKSEIEKMPNNIVLKFHKFLPFKEFCKKIANYDLFFDLRIKDKENNKCLPIKLFYYIACGRPVIFSNLDAISLQVPEINEMGNLINPNDYEKVSKIIADYIADNDKYYKHSAAAMQYSVEKYNWSNISDNFLNFIENECH
ncbi:glycosyltransferase [Bacteroidales bacterium OttesenSCG-928-K03]|nr:glycosyltransferase [Odoribacter sp. OttesenSCG-928-L07]MDL2239495.1 glycosyltransferase [Bacteroidales bacterium OttesenSCG-928-L14]MDL2240447.1 glycosyltransferase [Bacteroidales bacterium OttesenSCG-928-K22]MDL2242963.1 glycosyltransferase [Bacteroidales bacterium OttesenSCG-928-K03]